MNKTITIFIFVIVVVFSTQSVAAELRIDVRDADGNPVENAVAYLIPDDPTVLGHRDRTVPVLTQENRLFVPFVLPVRVGEPVTITNDDEVRHHVYSFSETKSFELRLFGNSESNDVTFEQTGVVPVGCNIHDNMLAFIFVTDAPIFELTGNDGVAHLKDLPDGRYSLGVWHVDQRNDSGKKQISVSSADVVTMTWGLDLNDNRQQQFAFDNPY